MANEITRIHSLACTTSLGATLSSGSQSDTITQTAAGDVAGLTQNIAYHATTAVILDPGACTGSVHAMIKNLDTARTVNIYSGATWGSAVLMSQLLAGESCSFSRVLLSTLYAVADAAGADIQIEYWLVEV